MSVKTVEVLGDDPMKTILGYLDGHVVDLMVLAAHQRTGAARWLKGAVAEPLARETYVLALFVPPGADGFVSLETGAACGRDTIEVTLIHIGGHDSNPHVVVPTGVPGTWTRVVTEGNATDVILETVDEISANLIVMATAGQHGFLDALRVSTTERVIRSARCPVLAVPADIYE
jgi:nucleotide-binding universal stress UspA family protein